MSINQDPSTAPSGGSYSQIIRASALLGGVQGLVYFISLVRGKVIAVLLGANGIGALSLFQSIVQSAQTLTNMGIPTSGVREIAAYQAQGEKASFNRSIVAVRRLTLVSAVLGLALTVATSAPLSSALGQENISAFDIQLLGLWVFFACLAVGEGAVLQGLRKLKELAGAQAWSAIVSLPCSIAPPLIWGMEGLAPGLAASAALSYAITRRATCGLGDGFSVSWRQILQDSEPMLRLGGAVVANAIASSAVMLATKAIVTRNAGLEANGILQAASMVAGIFVVFLFSAMGTDFLPRLSVAKGKPTALNRLVNEQIEIAVLLSAPGLLLILALCPWLIPLFYSPSFMPGVDLVPWLLVGNLIQMISWPLGSLQIILARPIMYAATQLVFHATHLGLIAHLFPVYGLQGIAASFLLCHASYLAFIFVYAYRVNAFVFDSKSVFQIILSFGLLFISLTVGSFFEPIRASTFVMILACISGIASAKHLSSVLPSTHKLQPLIAWVRFFPTTNK